MAWALRGDERCIVALRWDDLAEVNVESVRAHQQCAFLQIRTNFRLVDISLHFIRQQDVNEVSLLNSLGNRHWLETVANGEVIVRATRALANDDVATAVAKVLSLCMSLAAVAEDGNDLILQEGKVRIGVVINCDWHFGLIRCQWFGDSY